MFASSKSGSVSAPTDSKFNYVTMLLHGNGTNGAQNNTFLDSSTNNFTITRNGNTTQGTFSPYGSNWSNYFDGSGDYLSTPSNAAFTLGSSGDFTIETWVYLTATPSDYTPFGTTWVNASSTYSNRWFLGIGTSGRLTWFDSAGNFGINESSSITLNTWLHIAVVRSGSTITMYKNGVSVGTQTTNQSYTTDNSVSIGYIASGNYLSGYISNLRIVKGTAVYISAFTPSTTPLTAVTNTSLLTCQSNRFIDNSTNNFTITKNGDTSVQRFSPFNPTTAYSTSVIGGSGYFDGSGDSLKVTYGSQMNLTNQDFAIEFWLYIPSALSNRSIVCQDQSNYQLNAYVDTSNNLTFYSYQAAGTQNFAVAMGAVPVGAWSHFVIARTGSTVAGFRNGTRIATATFSGSIDAQTGGWYLGAVYSNLNQINGYLSDVRFVIGSNPYGVGTTLTIPTAPLTAVTNTQFLASFTNAGILDNAMMNDLETVGNAQISTSVKKYGTGSLAFDGTDDRLTTASSPNMSFGTGDFTIEGWFYINSGSGTNNGALQISGTTGGLQANQTNNIALYSADSSGIKWGAYYANTFAYGSASTTQTWTHVALVRSSGSLKLYINGTADATFGTKTDTTNYTGQNICVGGYYSTLYLWNGYIDDLRITKGYARYTSNFTAPTAAFADKG